MRTLDLDTRLEELTRQYAAARDTLTAHPQFADYATLVDVPDDLGGLIRKYETASQALQRNGIPVVSIVSQRNGRVSVDAKGTDQIIIPNITLYDAEGNPWRKYEHVSLDSNAARDEAGNYLIKNQPEWIDYWSERGRVLPSLPVWYAMLERLYDTKHPGLGGIIDNLKKSWLATGTRVDYGQSKVIHDYGFPGMQTISGKIPEGNHWLKDILAQDQWRTAIQSLLLCKDVDKAVSVLQKAAGVPPYIWTADKRTRDSHPQLAVWLNASADWLNLDGSGNLASWGRSRSVALK
ncbi:hypothetical protein HY495_03215 [Candidatus Woesearchaeota archaeon]|nr:hypothetical protein [Candidatus Woesearchaeota archaeon]